MKKSAWLATASLMLAAPVAAPAQRADLAAGQAAAITPAERQQGARANAGIVAEYGGRMSGRAATYVEGVGRRIATQSGLSSNPGAFDVTLLNSPVNNAFAIPGGYIYVTRQLLALMNDEAELAAVLGHEVGHVAARHSQSRQRVAQRNSILGALGQLAVGAVTGNSGFGQLLGRGVGTGAQLLTLGYSRKQETESDDLGINYLRRARYDPEAMASMLDALASQTALEQQLRGDARATPAWASTHPDPGARVERAAQQAGPATGMRNRDAFLAAIDGLLYGDDPKQGVIEGQSFLYPPGRVAFTVPAGYTMQNGAKAVSISGQGGQAQFAAGAYDGNLERYVGAVLRGLGATNAQPAVERMTIGGFPAAVTTVRGSSGQTQVDVTIVAYATDARQAYHFSIVTPAGRGVAAFAPMIDSFRRMTAEDNRAARPRYLRVITVKQGETVQSLARRMAYTDAPVERFQVLNRLGRGDAVRAGDKVKIVTY
ncbi:peptidase M48 Ste24p [Sphingomonas spermidinifaciens]|uniref:Peptidase M48 Ste24p n=1 Tax=Sphingomonas spermidinifaciens TaxID=1141889 RepID=A0A2A4B076_9SPHN|nr:M48 family metalloprotease [Sphingomonas spermidinifaciens]PCD01821.1 peptidase M48 Ste24p [Sphingomonas spermidinifaciens]